MTLVSDDLSRWPSINADRVSSYLVVAASAGIVYDWALTFGQEVEFIWRHHWSLMTVLYLSKWLGLCEEGHGDICESVWWMGDNRSLPGFMRIVDVVSMAIVPEPPACRYDALSYIWGGIGAEYWMAKDNFAERSTPGGLNITNFPDTIIDSIQLVRQLGERYRWIDTLCIIQDDIGDKIIQIHAMDSIYGGSYFTIYAAGGTSARDPLPGLRPRTRPPQQHIEVVQGLHLSVPLPPPIEALNLSAWSTRGWTYQELMLSRRRIYFTGQQVYFECRRDIFCEDVVAESKFLSSSTQPLRYKGAGNFTYLRKPTHTPPGQSVMDYMYAIGPYTRRNLTVESDIVDAITAMTNVLAKGFELGGGDPAKSFQFGMTLIDLGHALVWQHDPHTPRARRSIPGEGKSAWPSWAWATWRGAVRYVGETLYAWLDSTLIFRTTSSHFSVVRRDDGGEDQKSSARFYHGLFNILSSSSTWVGSVILPLDPAPPASLEFAVLSRTSAGPGVCDEESLGMFYSGCMLYVMAISVSKKWFLPIPSAMRIWYNNCASAFLRNDR
ncbi:heterokaryon incompatibility protein-domain-containing protein [Suillus paluster]|uniref:heterokaryon incompatibility protein-domain-containing protein n=1 Tax=Suillus paluster TaxID=48578 RepID=UPI001B86A0BE|nr:heterokaryon incompatibility protein-domain-containing protein [Suillus paluster]KAG1744136.1 heterokaryon incompatibility protein-domain-containing protein [Suillus paluster]